MSASPTARTAPVIPSNNELALERNRLANERTMMAWIRTSVSLISFGFSIFKFFEFLEGKHVTSNGILGPRRFGIAMIGIGLFVLFAAVGKHWWEAHVEHKAGVGRDSLATIVAGLIAIAGMLALVSVTLQK